MIKLNEKQIIDLFFSKLIKKNKSNVNLRDDVSVIFFQSLKDNHSKYFTTNNLVIKSDMLVESTDVVKQMAPWQMARKSVVSSVSDMSAKGISSPFYSVLSLGIPRTWTKNKINNLILGFQRASKEFDITFLGGDTNESKELIIDCVLIGFLSPKANYMPKRNGAINDDVVVVSGEFGYSASGLNILLKNCKAKGEFKEKAIESVLNPSPRHKFGKVFGKYFSSSIDSSDGLSTSLYELATQSKADFFIDSLPLPEGLKEFSETNSLDLHDLIFNGGEEYEIVATIKPSNFKKIVALSNKFKLKVIVIGKVKSGNGRVFVKSDKTIDLTNKKRKMSDKDYYLLKNQGYMHFC